MPAAERAVPLRVPSPGQRQLHVDARLPAQPSSCQAGDAPFVLRTSPASAAALGLSLGERLSGGAGRGSRRSHPASCPAAAPHGCPGPPCAVVSCALMLPSPPPACNPSTAGYFLADLAGIAAFWPTFGGAEMALHHVAALASVLLHTAAVHAMRVCVVRGAGCRTDASLHGPSATACAQAAAPTRPAPCCPRPWCRLRRCRRRRSRGTATRTRWRCWPQSAPPPW